MPYYIIFLSLSYPSTDASSEAFPYGACQLISQIILIVTYEAKNSPPFETIDILRDEYVRVIFYADINVPCNLPGSLVHVSIAIFFTWEILQK